MVNKNNKSIRLPKNIQPIKYTLTLKTDIEAFVFSGKEVIDIIIKQKTNKIILHSKDIDIETAKIIIGKKIIFASKISYNIKSETAILLFKEDIFKTRAKLSIVFSGIINDGLRGFYKSRYILNGKEKHLATTQFEATDARRAFPCFDEPAQKAIFEVSLIIREEYTAISNTLPINIEKHEGGYKIVNFSPSPLMSTYLLAFMVGEFEFIKGKTKKGIEVRVFTTPGKTHQAKFALNTAIKSLEFYNEYFKIPYPLPNLDMIAIPDFESGAMENWGAITYRETAILVDEKHTSLSNKQWVATVIAHEIAHQWFGNLVTMHWWTDLWLNEGFASYMENFCINKLFPEWKMWDLYLSGLRYGAALSLDSLINSHPIEITVQHPEEINEIFDMVSYTKGSAIIRMLALFLGEIKFRDGLRYYLKEHSYKNTETLNLWQALEKVSKKPIKKMMNTWTKQIGYPILSVRDSMISQERFLSSRIHKRNIRLKNLWYIPLQINNTKILFNKSKQEFKHDINNKINLGEQSFIVIKYDEKILNKIKDQIINKKLIAINRLAIIRDLFALAEGGYIETTIVLDFVLNYKNETEYIVWTEIASGLSKIYNLISEEKFKEQYKKFALKLFSPLAKNIGWSRKKNEDHLTTLLRSLALNQAGFYGDQKVIKQAQKLFRSRKIIEPDLRLVVYGLVARNGNDIEWNKFKKLYKKENMYEKKERYAYALSKFSNKKLLKKTLDFCLSENVKNQDAPFIINYTWLNEYGRDITWKFIKKNWPEIIKNYGEGGNLLSRLLNPLKSHTKQSDLTEIKKFFIKNKAPGAERTLKQAYEKIESNIAWLRDDKKNIEKWLNKNFSE